MKCPGISESESGFIGQVSLHKQEIWLGKVTLCAYTKYTLQHNTIQNKQCNRTYLKDLYSTDYNENDPGMCPVLWRCMEPTPLAICPGYIECVWLHECVLHTDTWLRPLLFLPPTHTQSVNPSCCLILNIPTTHTHTRTHTRLKQTWQR